MKNVVQKRKLFVIHINTAAAESKLKRGGKAEEAAGCICNTGNQNQGEKLHKKPNMHGTTMGHDILPVQMMMTD